MFRAFVLAAILCLLTPAALAAGRDFGEFTVDLPSGWTVQSEPESRDGKFAVGFANDAEGAVVDVLYTAKAEESMQALVQERRRRMERDGVTIRVAEMSATRAVFEGHIEGVDIKAIMILDPQSGAGSGVVLVENIQAGERFARRIKAKNSRLSFFP